MNRHLLLALTLVGTTALAGACGSVATAPDGGGGATGTGGRGGTTGAAGSQGGATAGAGGATGAAGTGGATGAAGTGGATGAGGSAGASGTSGAGGIAGTGGSVGGTGGAVAGAGGHGGTIGVAGTGGIVGTGGAVAGAGGRGGTTGVAGVGGIAGTIGVAGTTGTAGTGGSTPTTYAVTVVPAGTGTGTVTSAPAGINCGATCTASFTTGSMVTLTATPASTSAFGGWSGGGCTGVGTCMVTVDAAKSVTATFTLNPVLTVIRSGNGTVTSAPTGINCGTTCAVGFATGTMVTLTATAASGAHFEGWTGSGCTGRSTCTVTVDAAKSVSATFEAGPLALLRYRFDGDGSNSGSLAGYAATVNGTVTYAAGKVGQAAQFGSGGYSVVSATRAVLSAYPQYTISYWVNSTSPAASTAFLDSNNRSTAPYGGIQMGYSTATQYSLCVSTTTNSYLGGSCKVFAAPAAGAWHNVIIRYAGTGTGAGQGGNVEVYEDGTLITTVANDASNNPVFNAGIPDALYIGTAGISLDEVRVYNTTLTPAEQCAQIIGGTWTGSACTLP